MKEAEDLFRTKSTEEWGVIFEKHGVPAGPVLFIEELFDHPQTIENGLQVHMEHPLLGGMKLVGPPFQMSESPLAAQFPSPMLGEHNDEVMAEAGLSPERVAELRAAGIIL